MTEVKKDILWRAYLVYVVVLLFSLVIIWQIIRLQFVEKDLWKKKSDDQTIYSMKVDAIRGNICSDDGSLLATSVPIFDLYWDANVVSDEIYENKVDSLAYCLANMFKNKTKYEYKKILSHARAENEAYQLIYNSRINDEKTQISFDKLKIVKTFPIFKLGKNRGGLIITQKEKRVTPYQSLARRTIGYENEGTYVGLEGAYSKKMEGISGVRFVKKIAGGIWMPLNENEIEPQNGNDIMTTIDIELQDVAENSLRKNLIANNADHGCVILMEVSTGHIKAISNLTRTSEGIYFEKYNYAIGEKSDPGSTFKLMSLVAGIDDGMVKPEDMVAIGKMKYADREMEDSHINGYGPVTVRRAFEISSNVGISQAIYKVYKNNPQRFIDKLKSMRLDKPLGLEIGGEAIPNIKNAKVSEGWSKVSLPWIAHGYEVELTPMQILAFYNAIANDGKLVKPVFVEEIRNLGKTVEKFNPIVLKESICSKATALTAKSLLEGVVENGTGKSLKNPLYKIAGKTGTAQLAMNNKGYGNKESGNVSYKASFAGYFPADAPKYSCIVVVNSPSKGAYYGGAVAAPVFKEIADRVFAKQLEILQQKNYDKKSIATPYVKAANQKDIYTIYKKLDFATLSQNPEAEWVSVSSVSNKA
ncbi:MAG: penicillin-binding protein 2, partial [Bacteroidetes bacterium]|nr:penicillin-binding protein 2 [Bacteroidota bacterium]